MPPRIIWEPDNKEMILVSGGTCTMGRDDGPENTRPAHRVVLAPYYVDLYPVTQGEYHLFCQRTGHPVPSYDVDWVNTDEYNWNAETREPPMDKLDHPVVLVSWHDARAYADWARKRLLTEAEWERAARGAEGYRWPWGNDFVQSYSNTYGLGIGRTTTVYRFDPQGSSPEGVADLVGNVWEWTSSLYLPYPYDAQDGREDPAARGFRVLRGGSWFNEPLVANATARLDGDFIFYTNVGFRCGVSAEKVRMALEKAATA